VSNNLDPQLNNLHAPEQTDRTIRRVLMLGLPAVIELGEDDTQTFQGHSFHLGVAYIAAILRNTGLNVRILDCYAEDRRHLRPNTDLGWQELGLDDDTIIEYIHSFKPDLIGITIPFSCQHYVARTIARLIKDRFPSVVIVAGGNHVSAVPNEIDRAIFDYLIIGEGEYTLLQLIQALDHHESVDAIPGVLSRNATEYKDPPHIDQLDGLPFPALDLLPLQKLWGPGRRWINMVATRGCVYECNFCSIHTVMGRKVRRRSVANVIDEIKHWKQVYRIQEVYFEDDNLTINKRWAKELFRRIAACNFRIRFYVRNGIRADSIDKELLELMKAAGFQDIVIAPESGSQRTLDVIIGKKMKLEDCTTAVKLAHQVHLGIGLFFVIGFPEETWQDIAATIAYARQLKQLGANGPWISLASPYPGTRFFSDCAARNLISKDFDYRRCRTEDYQIINPHYSAAELKAYRAWAMIELTRPHNLTSAVRNGLELLLHDPPFFFLKLRYKLNV
jgi:radical SAM superfamily enzyme YgiQ (UPF0313 family)